MAAMGEDPGRRARPGGGAAGRVGTRRRALRRHTEAGRSVSADSRSVRVSALHPRFPRVPSAEGAWVRRLSWCGTPAGRSR